MYNITKLEKLVGKYQDENRPLLIDKKEMKYDSSDYEEDIESGQPRIIRLKKCLHDEHPYRTLAKSIIVIGGIVGGIVCGITVYHKYF